MVSAGSFACLVSPLRAVVSVMVTLFIPCFKLHTVFFVVVVFVSLRSPPLSAECGRPCDGYGDFRKHGSKGKGGANGKGKKTAGASAAAAAAIIPLPLDPHTSVVGLRPATAYT